MHGHHDSHCQHELRYCSMCDIAYCKLCRREWKRESSYQTGQTVAYPYATGMGASGGGANRLGTPTLGTGTILADATSGNSGTPVTTHTH